MSKNLGYSKTLCWFVNFFAPAVNFVFLDKVENIERIPKRGPFIIVSNHVSFPDAWLLVNIVLKQRNFLPYFIGRDDFWLNIKWTKFLAPKGRVLLIDWRDPSAVIRDALSVLLRGEVVGVFPEGARNMDKDVLVLGKTGAVKLALLSGAPVVPVGYIGPNIKTTWDVIRDFIAKQKKARIVVGNPINFPRMKEGEITRELLYNLTDNLMIEIGKLCAKSPRLHSAI